MDIIFLSERNKSAPLSAYAFKKIVDQKFGFQISAGTVYALLYSMERGDLVKREVTQTKRIYELTKKGTEVIDSISVLKDEIFQYTKNIF
ncbi:MAG: helix-turn-helix transcriptional regulator [Candidatus Bathyarchaeota archaeon]|nr:helix-turn-helix transcriptional regulator [Candidatus Bathyarchaeota archaeon]